MEKQLPDIVTTRLDKAVILSESLRRNADRLVPMLSEALGDSQAEARRDAHRLLADRIDARAEDVRSLGGAVSVEMQDDHEPRSRRDTLAEDLYNTVGEVKPTLVGVFGADSLTRYGLDGTTPRNPPDLSHHVANTIQLMEQAPASQTNRLGLNVDTADIVALLEPMVDELRDAIADVEGEGQDLASAYAERDAAIERFDALARYARDTAVADYTLGGRPDLADRLRSRLRGRAQSTSQHEQPEATDDTTADDDVVVDGA